MYCTQCQAEIPADSKFCPNCGAPLDYNQRQQAIPPQPQRQHSYLPPVAPALPADGNTSGMSTGYPIPDGVDRFSFVGCIPFGIFALANKISAWGIIGLIAGILLLLPTWITPLAGLDFLFWLGTLVYSIYICVAGRKLAWLNRRFDSLEQYHDTMAIWNRWGIGCLVASILLYVLVIFAITLFSTVVGGALLAESSY